MKLFDDNRSDWRKFQRVISTLLEMEDFDEQENS